MSYASTYNLQPADCIVEPLFQTGISKHFVLFLGVIGGVEMMAENHKFNCVQIISANEYFNRNPIIDRIERFPGSDAQRIAAVKKAISMQGKKYDLLSYNCEHFVSEVITGKPISKQVKNALYILGAVLLFQLITD